ncbi:hypothetical protein SDC9_205187 [bioreactor metagenome]|uniref:Uncharacterized protein n=1 Tax=bioreactor metagenome TaxID=1076179 RepID=A0A645JD64_9ZZZZ
MEFLIGLEKSIDTAVTGCAFEAAMDILQGHDVARFGITDRFGGTTSFEHCHEREDVVEVLARDFGDVAAPTRTEFDQSLRGKHLQCFA